MRVLFWTELFYPDPGIGGVEVAALPLLHGLQKQGVECAVVTTRSAAAPQDEDSYEGIPVYRFPFHTAVLARQPAQIAALVHRIAEFKAAFQPDLIHINTLQPSLYFHQRTRAAYPTLLTIHEPPPNDERNSMFGREILHADWISTPSQAMRARIEQLFPEAAPRLTCIPYGLALPSLHPAPLPEKRILCLGRLRDIKGFDLALDAFAAVLRQMPDAHLTIAGDGDARDALIDQAEALGILQAVDFPGYVAPSLIPALINRATIVVVPSRWFEVFGLAAAEAGSMARPVIAARTGGLPEVVLDGTTGLVVEPENSSALAAAMLELLAQPERAAQMGFAGYEHVKASFSLPRYIDDTLSLYRQLTAERFTS